MLMLGFSSGLPFFLSGNTLGYWLRDAGTTLATIGFLSWVGLAYSLKFLWAPVIDRVDAPLFGRFGRRRGWMMVSQIAVAAGLTALAVFGLSAGLAAVGAFALVVAFSSSTQDIVVDAWRIEAASDADELGLLSSAYQLGYRAAIIVTDALILISANHFGWRVSYGAMAALMAVGIGASLVASRTAAHGPRGRFESRNAAVERPRVRRRRHWPVHGVLPNVRLARAADARDDQLLPVAGVRDGADGEPLLPRPRPLERRGRRRSADRSGWSRRSSASPRAASARCASAISER